jgi:predicted DNA-binding antitoxin AbrB/MazE fold protein
MLRSVRFGGRRSAERQLSSVRMRPDLERRALTGLRAPLRRFRGRRSGEPSADGCRVVRLEAELVLGAPEVLPTLAGARPFGPARLRSLPNACSHAPGDASLKDWQRLAVRVLRAHGRDARAPAQQNRATLSIVRPIEARYEDGILKPERPLSLRAGERVGVILVRRPDPARWDLQRLAAGSGDEDKALATAGLGDWANALDAEDRR